jgi:hypothetical protein
LAGNLLYRAKIDSSARLWAVPYALLYTSFFLGLMRNSNFLPAHVFWRRSKQSYSQQVHDDAARCS